MVGSRRSRLIVNDLSAKSRIRKNQMLIVSILYVVFCVCSSYASGRNAGSMGVRTCTIDYIYTYAWKNVGICMTIIPFVAYYVNYMNRHDYMTAKIIRYNRKSDLFFLQCKVLLEVLVFATFLICAFILLHKDKKEESVNAVSESNNEDFYSTQQRMTKSEFIKKQTGKIGDKIIYNNYQVDDSGPDSMTIIECKITKELTDEYKEIIELLGKNDFDRKIGGGEITFTDNRINEECSFLEIDCMQEVFSEIEIQLGSTFVLKVIDDEYNEVAVKDVKSDAWYSELAIMPEDDYVYLHGVNMEMSDKYGQCIALKKGQNHMRYLSIVSDSLIDSGMLAVTKGAGGNSSFIIKLN